MTETPTRASAAATRCLTVVFGPRRYDIVVDEVLPVREVLALVLPGLELEAMTVGGQPLELDQRVADSALATGSMVLTTVVRGAVVAPRVRANPIPAPGPRAPGPAAPADLAALATAGSRTALTPSGPGSRVVARPPEQSRRSRRAAAEGQHGSAPQSPGSPERSWGSSRSGLVITVLVLAALAVFAFARAHTQGSAVGLVVGLLLVVTGVAMAQVPAAPRSARLLSPVLGLAGGAVASGQLVGGAHVPVIGACAAAALVALAGRAGIGPDRGLPRVWLGFTAAVGALTLAALVSGAGMSAVAVLGLAGAVLLARVVPDLVLDVADDVLLDIGRLSVTSWSPREARRRLRRGWRIDDLAVRSVVAAAVVEQLATLVGLAAVAAGSAAVLVPDVLAGPRLPLRLLLACSAVALALTARAYRRRRDRVLLRWAAIGPAVALLVPWVAALGMPGAVWLAAVAVPLGLVVAGLSTAVARGYRSLWAARLADLAEMVALLGVLPLAIWASGLLEWATGLLA